MYVIINDIVDKELQFYCSRLGNNNISTMTFYKKHNIR